MAKDPGLPTPSPSASSSDPSDAEHSRPQVQVKRRRVKKDGSSFKRNGRIIGKLRAGHQVEVLDLGRASTTLVREECAASLAYHLVALSNGLTTVPNSPPVVDMGKLHNGHLKTGWRLRDDDPRQEVLIAALTALGARRSNHSSITGVIEGRRILGSKIDANMSMEEVAELQLGMRREATCRSLAQRAVDMAIDCKLLEDNSDEARRAASILRVALFAVNPRHAYASKLAANLHEQQVADLNGPINSYSSTDYMSISSVEYDMYIAVLRRVPPTISDIDLYLVYGWHHDQVQGALQYLQDKLDGVAIEPKHDLRHPGRVIATGLLKEMSYLQRQKDCTLAGLPVLCESLHRIFTSLDAMEKIMCKFQHESFKHPEAYLPHRPPVFHPLPFVAVAPHLGAIPMLSEACLCSEVTRLLTKLAETEPKVQELIFFVKKRFLAWLKLYCGFLNDPQFSTDAASRHTRALLLSILDLYEDWLDLCVAAARQHSSGKGPFASIGFTWEDVKQLKNPLAHASTIFARSSRQYHDLTEALERFSLSSSDSAVARAPNPKPKPKSAAVVVKPPQPAKVMETLNRVVSPPQDIKAQENRAREMVDGVLKRMANTTFYV